MQPQARQMGTQGGLQIMKPKASAKTQTTKLCNHCGGVFDTTNRHQKLCPLHHRLYKLGIDECPTCKGDITSDTMMGCANGKRIYGPHEHRRRCTHIGNEIEFTNSNDHINACISTEKTLILALLNHRRELLSTNSPYETGKPDEAPSEYSDDNDDDNTNPFKPWGNQS